MWKALWIIHFRPYGLFTHVAKMNKIACSCMFGTRFLSILVIWEPLTNRGEKFRKGRKRKSPKKQKAPRIFARGVIVQSSVSVSSSVPSGPGVIAHSSRTSIPFRPLMEAAKQRAVPVLSVKRRP